MNIGKFSIENKYLILSITIAIVILGIFSKSTLKTQLAPETNAPTATVMTQYPGASAQDVVNNLSEPLEEEFGTLDGISLVQSTSQDNMSIISLQFTYETDIDSAAIDIQNTISRIRNQLPDNIDEPKVLKFSTSDKPILTLGLKSESVDMRTIREITENEIGYEMQLIDGVASIDIFGGYNSLVKVDVDKRKAFSYGVTLEQISEILRQNNINAPGGKLVDGDKEVLIRIEEGLESIEDVEKIKIPLEDGNSVDLKDIADIELSIENLESNYRLNGESAISILVTKRSDSNTVEVVDNVKKSLEILEEKYPFIEFEIAQDDSIFTNQMVDNMTTSVLTSIILTIVMITLFISNVGQSLVVAMSMPLVFLATLGMMKLTGMSLDMVTLSALILSIGFVVDASIVIVENINSHHNDQGKNWLNATIDGTSEMALSSIAGATTTLAVLLPLIFIEGFVGEMFRPLSMTLIYAITSSVIIALIIIPLFTVMVSKYEFIRTEKIVRIFSVPFNKMMDKLLELYMKLLEIALKNKAITLLIVLGLTVVSGLFLKNNGLEMLPQFDSGLTFVTIEMEPGTSLDETTYAIKQIENSLNDKEIIVNYYTQIGFEKGSNLLSDFGVMGTNQGMMTINLTPRTDRKETIWEFQDELQSNIEEVPGIERFIVKEQGGTASANSKAPIDIKISGNDQELLYSIAVGLQDKVEEIEGTSNLYKSFNIDNLQLNVKLDSLRLQELGIPKALVSKEIFESMEGIIGTNMNMEDIKNIDISVEYMDEYKESIDNLLDMYIDSPKGVKVPLRDIAEIDIKKRANIITREDLQPTINILGYTQTRAFSHITKDINNLIDQYELPNGYSIEMTGEQKELGDSMLDMVFLLSLAIILVYLILVSQLKSFLHPVTIMSSIPLVVLGVAPALALTGKYMSMPVLLGFILLAGTVVNDSIHLLDGILSEREDGKNLDESIKRAVRGRYRAIMMTTFSDVTGMLPLAMQLALGSERFSPLAITVIGGMLSTTFLVTIIVPVVYSSFEGIKESFTSPVSKLNN